MKHLPIAGLFGFFLLLHVLGEDEQLFRAPQEIQTLSPLLTPVSIDDSFHRDELSWILIEKLRISETLKESIFPSFTNILHFFQQSGWEKEVNVSASCRQNLQNFDDKRKNGDIGTLQMWDASGKPSSGFLWGNWFSLGFYSECLDVNKKGLANSAYFLVKLTITSQFNRFNNVTPHSFLGICLPEECSSADIRSAVIVSLKVLPDILRKSVIEVNVIVKKGDTSLWKDRGVFISLCIISILVALLIVATICDISYGERNEDILSSRILTAFSAKRNLNKIFDMTVADTSVSCIHGIKALSMLWIIFAHTYYFGLGLYGSPLKLETINDLWFQTIICGISAVTSFITISGFLLAYIFFTKIKEKGETKLELKECSLIVLLRYWRLVVPFASTFFLFYFTTGNYFSNGPLWPEEGFLAHCKSNWWRSLLFLNAFYSVTEVCCEWSWYLSVEMVLLFLGLLFLIIFSRSKVGALFFWIGSLIGSWVIGAIIIIMNMNFRFERDIIATKYTFVSAADEMYSRPHFNAGPYLMGIAIAYLVVLQKPLLSKLPMIFWIFGWLLAIGAAFVNIFGLYMFDYEDDVILSSSILAMSRSGWGYVISWTLLSTIMGKAGFISQILSCPVFIPISRLSYCMYLIHPLIMQTVFHSSETPIHHSQLITMILGLGFQVASFLCALLLSLLIESPSIAIDRSFLRKQKAKEKQN